MQQQLILFDLDDTLIHCNIYFEMVLDQFSDLMGTWFASYGIQPSEFKKKQYELDTMQVNLDGFAPDHFPHSLMETYRYFCKMEGRTESAKEVDELLQLGSSVYNRDVEPYPFMMETLNELQEDGHILHLYTGGVPSIQQRKVEAMKLQDFFEDRIFIRQQKTSASLQDIIITQAFERERTWMIGNSLRTDIVPSLENGIHAIYVPAIREWEYNMVDVSLESKGAFFTVPTLKDVRSTINGYTASKGEVS